MQESPIPKDDHRVSILKINVVQCNMHIYSIGLFSSLKVYSSIAHSHQPWFQKEDIDDFRQLPIFPRTLSRDAKCVK
jgi:hypothetical protein